MKRKAAVASYLAVLAAIVAYTIGTSDHVIRDIWFAGCAWTGGVLIMILLYWDYASKLKEIRNEQRT